jgi:signal transduction histidine kinase
VSQDRGLDFTEGIVNIDERARDLVTQLNRVDLDVNGFVKELGNKDPDFKKKYLNRSIPSSKNKEEWLAVSYKNHFVYKLTKKELIQYLINQSSNQNNLLVYITDLGGKILYKTPAMSESQVNIKHIKTDAEKSIIQKNHENLTITRLYPITLANRQSYLVIRGVPKSTPVYMKETGVTPYILGLVTFILCFYLITKRKMTEIEDIAFGLGEIAKGNLNYRIREKSYDEVGSLATNINYMASELNNMIERQRKNEKLKDELITNVSHDLRTPLTSIMGYLRLVKDRQYKNQSQLDEYVDIAYGKSEQLKKLIEDLFDFTRLTNEGIQLKKEKVSLNQMIRQLIDELDPIAHDTNVVFSCDLPKEPIIIEVDPNQLVRAMENILTNAIKYSTPPGNVQVKMFKTVRSVHICVSNPCESLSMDKINRLFDRFYRVDTSRSSQKAGAGLGLAITKSIIELHHGTVHIEYENQRITLSIILPYEESEDVAFFY